MLVKSEKKEEDAFLFGNLPKTKILFAIINNILGIYFSLQSIDPCLCDSLFLLIQLSK